MKEPQRNCRLKIAYIYIVTKCNVCKKNNYLVCNYMLLLDTDGIYLSINVGFLHNNIIFNTWCIEGRENSKLMRKVN